MKRLFSTLAIISLAFMGNAQQLRTPAPSPTQTIKQDFGISSIELSYSRPSIKNRTYFDNNSELAPVGIVWRTGANAATTISFNDDVKIGNTDVKAGKYGLLTIPGKDKWTLIISKQTDVTNPNAYKESEDVVRVDAKPVSMDGWVENFTMQFANIKSNSCELHLMWGKTAVALPISQDIDSRIMKQIDNAVKKDNRPYYAAASYYLENGKDLNQALEWFNKAIEQNPEAFWVIYQKANCLAKLGRKAEAIEAAKKSLELSIKAKEDPYIKMNEKLIKSLQ